MASTDTNPESVSNSHSHWVVLNTNPGLKLLQKEELQHALQRTSFLLEIELIVASAVETRITHQFNYNCNPQEFLYFTNIFSPINQIPPFSKTSVVCKSTLRQTKLAIYMSHSLERSPKKNPYRFLISIHLEKNNLVRKEYTIISFP